MVGKGVTIVVSAGLGRMLRKARGDDSIICKSRTHVTVGKGVTVG